MNTAVRPSLAFDLLRALSLAVAAGLASALAAGAVVVLIALAGA